VLFGKHDAIRPQIPAEPLEVLPFQAAIRACRGQVVESEE